MNLQTIQSWDDVPLFDSEQAEADFWAENQVDARLMDVSVTASSEQSESITITLRMDPRMLSRIKRLARFRFTANGIAFLATTTAKRAGSTSAPTSAGPIFKRKGPQSSREPWERRRWKSAEARIRRSRGRRMRLLPGSRAEALAAELTTSSDDLTAALGLRAGEETALAGAGDFRWAVGGLHGG